MKATRLVAAAVATLMACSCGNAKTSSGQEPVAETEGVTTMEIGSIRLITIRDDDGERRMPNKLFYGKADSAKVERLSPEGSVPSSVSCFLVEAEGKKVLFDTAKRLGCNKIALGHHQDDILETLLMNLTFQGAFSTMPPVMAMDKFDMTIIRPLALLRESELRTHAEERGYRRQEKNCPYEKESNRQAMRSLLEQMERLNPEAANSLWSAMTNVKPEYLPRTTEER